MPHDVLPIITVEALAERVSQGLRDSIVSGALRPGERLVEDRLATQMGVSRAPVREALLVLQREGLVTSLPRRGVIVATLTKQDVQEIYGLRSALECQAGRGACRRITADDGDELVSLANAMSQSDVISGDCQKVAAMDLAFHRKVFEICGNRRLLATWLDLLSQVRLLQRHVLATHGLEIGDMARNHIAIVEALRSGDPDRAERCLRDHIEETAHEAFESFPDAQDDANPGRGRTSWAHQPPPHTVAPDEAV